MPLSDSSGTFMRVLRPKSSPAVLLLLPEGASEVSRFSCMKLPGVSGVYDYAGPGRNLRYRSRPCCLPPMQKRQRPDCIFSKLNTQPPCLCFAEHLAVCNIKLGAERFAIPFSQDSFSPCFMPVYPGAPHCRFGTRRDQRSGNSSQGLQNSHLTGIENPLP
jgi:hypothetical protein